MKKGFDQKWLDSVAMEGHGIHGHEMYLQLQRSVFTVQVIQSAGQDA
jgi:hypothetical protein